mgnify:CR=1 FL=1
MQAPERARRHRGPKAPDQPRFRVFVRRVSHGCIRLTNEHAHELMHMVEVGTPVLIY